LGLEFEPQTGFPVRKPSPTGQNGRGASGENKFSVGFFAKVNCGQMPVDQPGRYRFFPVDAAKRLRF